MFLWRAQLERDTCAKTRRRLPDDALKVSQTDMPEKKPTLLALWTRYVAGHNSAGPSSR